MPTIRLKVENKQVFALEEYCIVKYNKDYEVEFTFDAEWENYNVKTARFVFGGRVEDVVFEGNVCKMPMITKGSNVGIGVFSGDLESTTKAHIPCLKSILEEYGIPEDPSNDVYNQIIALLNKYLEQGGGGGSSSGITESEVRKIVEEVVAGEIEKLPVTIDASVDELTYAITIELKDKAGNVVSTKTVTLPIKDVDLTDYAKKTDLSNVDYLAYVNYKGSHYEGFPGLFQYDGGMYGGFFKSTTSGDGGNRFRIAKAKQSEIDARTPSDYHDGDIHGANHCKPIVPANVDYAVISVLTNYKGELLTDEQKASACETLGAVPKLFDANKSQVIVKISKEGVCSINQIASALVGGAVVERVGSSNIIVPEIPTDNSFATSKKYVDNLIANLQAQIDELKQ